MRCGECDAKESDMLTQASIKIRIRRIRGLLQQASEATDMRHKRAYAFEASSQRTRLIDDYIAHIATIRIPLKGSRALTADLRTMARLIRAI